MPLAAVRIGTPQSGTAAWYLLECIEGVKYFQVVQFLEAMLYSQQGSVKIVAKSELKALLGLAQSEREKENCFGIQSSDHRDSLHLKQEDTSAWRTCNRGARKSISVFII